MSTVTVYKPHPDPWHAFREDDPLGDAMAPPSAPYSVSKIAEEGVARYCARSFDLPVTIARMGAAYGDQGGLPVWHLDAIAAGEPVQTRWDPMPYSPIHDDDICAQLEPLLDAASVPATIVNWGGDEPVSVQEWSRVLRRAARASRPRWWSRRSPARRAGSVGDHDEAQLDHRPVSRRLARRVPPRGGALLPGPGRSDDRSSGMTRTAIRAATCCSPRRWTRPVCSDFGPGDFREGLDVLLESLERDADLSPATDADVVGDLRRRLVNRLEVEAWYREHPEIEELPVRGPVDINGLPRTGTTALANMLSLDPQFRCLRGWEQVAAVPAADARERGHRSAAAAARAARTSSSRAELKAMHLYDVDATMEDTELLGMAFHGQQYTLPVYGYHAWWRACRHDVRRTTTTGAS